MAKAASGATLGARVSLSLSGTSKPYSSKSLGLFASQVVFPYFILNHIPHLAQQLTPDVEGLCFGGAVVLSSSFDNFLKSFQANCRPEVGSYTLRLDVFVPGLNGSSLAESYSLDPFFFFWFFGIVEEGELLEDEWEGFTACCCELFGPLLFPLAFFLGSLDVFCCFLFG